MNLGFLVDASAAVELSGDGNFNKTLDFIASFIESFSVTPNETHVGLVVFSDDPSTAFDFNRGSVSSITVEAVYNATYLNQGRQTGKAMTYIRRYLFSDPVHQRAVPNYLLYLTTGSSYDLLKTPATLVRDDNITVFAVGIGNNNDNEELNYVTGGNGTRIYQTSVDRLADVGTLLKRKICESK